MIRACFAVRHST